MSIVLYDVVAGKGIAVGHAHLITHDMTEVPQYDVSDDLIDAEATHSDATIRATYKELEQLRSTIPENASTELGTFISLRLMLLTDMTFSCEPVNTLKEQKINTEQALEQQSSKLTAQFNNIEDDYLRERRQDMLQAVRRVHNSLVGQNSDLNLNDSLFEDTILIAHGLSSADTVSFKEQKTTVFTIGASGPTSYTTILGRSPDIPSVIGLHSACKLIVGNETVIVDDINGVLIIEPDEVVLNEYCRPAREYRNHKRELNELKKTTATTAGGVSIELLASIESTKSIKALHNFGVDSVGLLRNEFLYLNHGTMPSEDEQYEVYSVIVKKVKGKSVTFRTVDLGVNENPRWSGQNTVPNGSLNPALGLADIRPCLAESAMFHAQICAILRAAAHGVAHTMWPVVTSVSEVRQCLIHPDTAQRQLAERGETFSTVSVGCMIEIPPVAMTAGSILKLIDFVSIGISDLIQYALSVDRGDDNVNHLYQPGHLAVLKTIQHIIRTTNRAKKGMSICGEIVGDTTFARILFDMGLRRFSMNPNNPLAVKNIVLHNDTERFRHETAKLLYNNDPEKSEKLLKALDSTLVIIETAQ